MAFDFSALAKGAVQWVRAKFQFQINGAPVPAPVVKAAAEVAVNNARINMARLAEGLNDRQNVAQWYGAMKQEVKMLHMAQAALARGGFEQMRPADYKRLQPIIAREYEYLRGFAETVAAGRKFGDVPSDSKAFLDRAGKYAAAGRATYENERIAMHIESGFDEAQRLLGGAAHCDDCLNWAALGWIPAEEMASDYPIGASECGQNCHCVLQFRKGAK